MKLVTPWSGVWLPCVLVILALRMKGRESARARVPGGRSVCLLTPSTNMLFIDKLHGSQNGAYRHKVNSTAGWVAIPHRYNLVHFAFLTTTSVLGWDCCPPTLALGIPLPVPSKPGACIPVLQKTPKQDKSVFHRLQCSCFWSRPRCRQTPAWQPWAYGRKEKEQEHRS